MHHRLSTASKPESGKSEQMAKAFGGPCFRQFNFDVGFCGTLSGAAMQDVGDYVFSHGKQCSGQTGGKLTIFHYA